MPLPSPFHYFVSLPPYTVQCRFILASLASYITFSHECDVWFLVLLSAGRWNTTDVSGRWLTQTAKPAKTLHIPSTVNYQIKQMLNTEIRQYFVSTELLSLTRVLCEATGQSCWSLLDVDLFFYFIGFGYFVMDVSKTDTAFLLLILISTFTFHRDSQWNLLLQDAFNRSTSVIFYFITFLWWRASGQIFHCKVFQNWKYFLNFAPF